MTFRARDILGLGPERLGLPKLKGNGSTSSLRRSQILDNRVRGESDGPASAGVQYPASNSPADPSQRLVLP
jgi:hypothetical protein